MASHEPLDMEALFLRSLPKLAYDGRRNCDLWMRELPNTTGLSAEDLCQEGLLRVHRLLDKYPQERGVDGFMGWASQVVKWEAMSRLARWIGQREDNYGHRGSRRKATNTMTFIDAHRGGIAQEEYGEYGGIFDRVIGTHVDDLTDVDLDVRMETANLAPRQREVIGHLRSGLTITETAMVLGVRPVTVNQTAKVAAEKMGLKRLSETFLD